MKFSKQILTVLLSTVLTAACSGSDSGTTASLPPASGMVKIDATNAAAIASEVAAAVFESGSLGDIVSESGVPVGNAGGEISKTGPSQPGGLFDYLANAPVVATTIACAVDGRVTISGEVADPATLTAGDNIALEFSACDDGEGQILDGVCELEINSFSGGSVQDLVHLNATARFNGFEVTEGHAVTSFNGGVDMDLDTTMLPVTSNSVSGTSLTISDSTDSVTLAQFHSAFTYDAGLAPEAYTVEASGTLSGTLFTGNVDYSTPVPFMGMAGQYPFAGELLVTGGDGSSVRLVALDNINVRLQIDLADGSGTITQDTTWVDLPAALGVSMDETGISGQVLMGPVVPGPEVPGQENEAPFSALFSVLRTDGSIADHFESDDNGYFSVSLPPGEYTIVPDASAPFPNAEHQAKSVTVPDRGFADVILRFDTGIR